MPANMENSAVTTGLEKVSFDLKPKGNAKECSNYHTTVLISHASKVMFEILQAWLNHDMNWELPDVQDGFENGRGTRDQIAENSRKTSTSASLTMLKPLTMWITTNWKILKEMGIPDHLTCLLSNLYGAQEATVRTRPVTTDWFKMGKEVHQGCILLPCLFNLYAEYIMQNAGLDEAQAGIKIAGVIATISDI